MSDKFGGISIDDINDVASDFDDESVNSEIKRSEETVDSVSFCPSCGNKIAEPGAVFCNACGFPLSSGETFVPDNGPEIPTDRERTMSSPATVDVSGKAWLNKVQNGLSDEGNGGKEFKKKHSKKITIALSVLSAVLMLIVLGSMLIGKEKKLFAPGYEKPIYTYIEALEKNDYRKYVDAKFTDNMKKKCIEFKFAGDEEAFRLYYTRSLNSIIEEDYSWYYGDEFDIKVLSIDAFQNNDILNLEKYSESVSEKYDCEIEITDFYTCLLQIEIDGSEESDKDDYIAIVGKIDDEWKVLYFYCDI